jgi:hypothetical protein
MNRETRILLDADVAEALAKLAYAHDAQDRQGVHATQVVNVVMRNWLWHYGINFDETTMEETHKQLDILGQLDSVHAKILWKELPIEES